MSELSHVDSAGRARMVDVSAKADTARIAVAGGELHTTAEVVALVRADDMPKADVLATARLAGIAAAKKTSELIPLCHQLALSSVKVDFGFTGSAITIEASAKTTGPTGVEMEALTAVAVAGLTLHDMVKAVDPAAVLNGVRLLTKEGGKRGHWTRPDTAADRAPEAGAHAGDTAPPSPAGSAGRDPHAHPHGGDIPTPGTGTSDRKHDPEHARVDPSGAEPSGTAVVVVASTGSAAGTRTDTTGPHLVAWLRALGYSTRGPLVYADADIVEGLAEALRTAPDLVVTTGGTGASPSDRTPEATLAVLDRELPGVAEAIRQRGTAKFPLAALSRGVAGLAGRSVVVNLPGSPGGVKDGIAVLEPLLEHLLAQVAGGGAHEGGQGAPRAERGNESAHA
ncbi:MULTISPECIES: bifunctional molybdenum cofactor biosynthesis protein MoaC/MoaB [Nocardia]|uniref:bifunctional molybdenum cofactor biosynthesis protein MoaC/MoaB n=1 Tax=Nocardia TaxID=1817 RepID=UPI0018949313|nr:MULTISPECIES: bifunctional molybdenum cofactor biosynthesis protein MoaC/MoaB [Nocardia]MBF6349156.1 bifunctional molybdenum cofactor biosynthesis protein MoaC/MoaB [Nocardia flavorosea]